MKRGTSTEAPSLFIFVLLMSALPVELVQAASFDIPAAEVAVITNPENTAEVRSLLRFELPEDLIGAEIELAIVQFRASVAAADGADVLGLNAFPVSTNWSEDSAEWDGEWTTPGGDYDESLHAVWMVDTGPNAVVRFDVTRMVRAWVTGGCADNGLIVRTACDEDGGVHPANAGVDTEPPSMTVYYATR